jgi:hypothetical protein
MEGWQLRRRHRSGAPIYFVAKKFKRLILNLPTISHFSWIDTTTAHFLLKSSYATTISHLLQDNHYGAGISPWLVVAVAVAR